MKALRGHFSCGTEPRRTLATGEPHERRHAHVALPERGARPFVGALWVPGTLESTADREGPLHPPRGVLEASPPGGLTRERENSPKLTPAPGSGGKEG